MPNQTIRLRITDSPQPISLRAINPRQPIRLTIHAGGGEVPWYTGETTVTPTQYQQELATASLRMPANVIVNPIPPDWGHILYNGFRLRVE